MSGDPMPKIVYLPCLDSPELAARGKRELFMERDKAAALGQSAVQISREGAYRNGRRERVDIGSLVQTAIRRKASIPPDAVLAQSGQRFDGTRVQVSNETTLNAGHRLLETSAKVLALNFANGIAAGGGFLHGARAQEECLCRSSSLYATLAGDPMYAAHARRPTPDSTDWAILSPDVPVFRLDDGTLLDAPYLLSFITCAAPYAPTVGKARSAELMEHRIHRVLEIARSYGYDSLVLGAWGCGAFDNDPVATARQFKDALSGDFAGAFAETVFAIVDWSPDRRLLGVFRDVFQE
jgi:uncharacterized protein (TIGR02452 family)